MDIDIYGIPKGLPCDLIAAAVMFSYEYYELPDVISTTVQFNEKDEPYLAVAIWDEVELEAEIFIYEGLSACETVVTIFHEMCHVKQAWKEELFVDIDAGIKEWLGVTYSYKDPDQPEYNDLPWEQDANRHEKLAFEAFRKKIASYEPSLLTLLSESDIVVS